MSSTEPPLDAASEPAGISDKLYLEALLTIVDVDHPPDVAEADRAHTPRVYAVAAGLLGRTRGVPLDELVALVAEAYELGLNALLERLSADPEPVERLIGEIDARGIPLTKNQRAAILSAETPAAALTHLANFLRVQRLEALKSASASNDGRLLEGRPPGWGVHVRALLELAEEAKAEQVAARARLLLELPTRPKPPPVKPRRPSPPLAPPPPVRAPTRRLVPPATTQTSAARKPRSFKDVRTANWKQIGILKLFGYGVGERSTQRPSERRAVLEEVFLADLSGVPDREEREKWGHPKSSRRRAHIVGRLRAFASLAARRHNADMRTAIAEWEADLRWASTTLRPAGW